MSLRHSYTLLAPIYDRIVSGPIDQYRSRSIARLDESSNQNILVNGIGTGMDMPYLPTDAHYVGTDITPAMLARARERASEIGLEIELTEADSQSLPFDDACFDSIIMHLILAVVPDPELALQESCRVLKPGGRILVFDKFIRPGQLAITRRMLNILLRHIATRTDVVFEDVLNTCPELSLVQDEPALAKGWFRLIELEKRK